MASMEKVEIMENAIMCRSIKKEGGYIKPYTTNSYIIREGKTVFVVDTGAGNEMKEIILSSINELKEGAENLVLINTRCHVNRISNNEYVMNTEGFKNKSHYMHEKAKVMLDPYSFYQKLYQELDKYYDVFEAPPPPWRFFTRLLALGPRDKHFKNYVNKKINKYEPVRMSPGTIQYLKDSDAGSLSLDTCMVDEVCMSFEGVSINLGPMEIKGWKIDDAFIIQSGGHSQDHMLVYFPEKKLLIAGDLTFEMFPQFMEFSNSKKVEETLEIVQELVKEGLVQIMVDSHHYEIFKGATQIFELVSLVLNNHDQFKKALMACFEESDGETIKGIYRKLRKQRYENPAVDFHLEYQFPRTPVYLKSIICSLLLEEGFETSGEGGSTLFSTPKVNASAVSE